MAGSSANNSRNGSRSSGRNPQNGSRGNSGRNTGNRKPASTNRNTQKDNTKPHQRSVDEYDYDGSQKVLVTVILVGVFLFLFLCNFGMCGKIGSSVSAMLYGAFGFEGFFAPIVILGFIIWYMYFSENDELFPVRITGAVCLFLIIGIFSDVFSGNAASLDKYDAGELYRRSSELKNGGGVIAGSISYALNKNIGTAGEVVICLLVLVLSLFAINKSFFADLFKNIFFGATSKTGEFVENSRRKREQKLLEMSEEEEYLALPMNDEEDYSEETSSEALTVTEKMNRDREEKKTVSKPKSIIDHFANNRIDGRKKKEEEKKVREETEDADKILDKRKVRPEFETRHTGEMHEMNYSDDMYPDDDYYENGEDFADDYYEEPVEDIQSSYDPARPWTDPSKRPGGAMPERSSAPIIPEFERVPVNSDHKISVTEEEIDVTEAQIPVEDNEPVSAPSVKKTGKEEVPEAAKAPARKNPSAKKAGPFRYKAPDKNYLKKSGSSKADGSNDVKAVQNRLVETLSSFGIEAEMGAYSQGPTVTRYEFTVSQGTKLSRVVGLSDEIKMALAATDIRIEAPIPGKSAIGIEVPNTKAVPVMLGDLLTSSEYSRSEDLLSFAVGKDIEGKTVVTNIAKFPHVLIAGTTGSGKSVCINTLILSLLYKASPEDVQIIMVDPKVVELKVYNGIPHLPFNVITNARAASEMLKWAVKEMERRYRAFADREVRDIEGYNLYAEDVNAGRREPMDIDKHKETESLAPAVPKMPRIVIIIDELADLMMVAAKEVEQSICRLAQLARAAGMHLVVATQRPSVDVITGLIKANMPSRIAFAVSSGVDSRTILDTVGAEKLLGKGDMLFYPQGKMKPERLQGAFVSDGEVSTVAGYLRGVSNDPNFRNPLDNVDGINELKKLIKDIEAGLDVTPSSGSSQGGAASASSSVFEDDLFVEAGKYIIRSQKASIGYLQRVLKIGFNRAARIMDYLSDAGVVGPEQGTKPREILMTEDMFDAYVASKSQSEEE